MRKSTKNRNKAAEFFNLKEGWVLHHKDVNMKTDNPERYKQWNVEDLVPMLRSEHMALHNSIRCKNTNLSEKHKQNISKGLIGRTHSAETRMKISESNKGKHNHLGSNNPNYGKRHTNLHWFNNGVKNVRCGECPEGYVKGKLTPR